MHFTTISPSTFWSVFLVLSATQTTFGLPAQLDDRTIYNPPINSPGAGDVYTAGSTTTVTWNTSSIPSNYHKDGMLVLGYMTDNDSSEHLDIEHPLALNFKLRAGSQTITFPSHLRTRDGYVLVLFGDSGNKSPKFTIKARP